VEGAIGAPSPPGSDWEKAEVYMDKLMDKRWEASRKIKSLDELRGMGVVGNAYHDMPVFEAADRLFLATEDAGKRKAILDFVGNEVMGIEHTHTDEEVTEHYVFLTQTMQTRIQD
jgi:hypothetical protein